MSSAALSLPAGVGTRPSAAAASVAPVRRPETFLRGAVCGGLGAMGASVCTAPLELLKVRLQLAGELDATQRQPQIRTVVAHMLRTEGFFAFYKGLSASMLRQALYGPARFGLYQAFMGKRWLAVCSGGNLGAAPSAQPAAGTLEKLVAATLSGAFGGLLSSPADLVLVRMQADGRLAKGAQRGYSGVFGGFARVVQESGWRGLVRGVGPNMQRAMVVTSSQFVSYDFFKTTLQREAPFLGQGIPLHFSSALLTGVVVASCACPMDVLRTRMMNSRKAAAGEVQPALPVASTASASAAPASAAALGPPATAYARAYNSTWECARETLRIEGARGLYKGFWPYYMRVAPQVTLMFVFMEAITKAYTRVVGDD